MKSIALFLILSLSVQLSASEYFTNEEQVNTKIVVENPISLIRNNETITLYSEFIKKAFPGKEVSLISVKDLKSNKTLTTQAIDYNQDGVVDEFLFQSDFNPNEKKEFELNIIKKENSRSSQVYASYMTSEEGMQDFTWENNFIGYRFYGEERSQKQGTGIAMDIWCKRVPELITEKWYAPSQSYHKDKGYGADHYKSGKNQGCGGSGIFVNDSIYFPKAFSDWKIIANGPIRVVFELKFTGWSLNNTIVETKIISLDAGHYFNKIESIYSSEVSSQNYKHAVGIVQRKKSEATIKQDKGFIACWESLGEGKGNLGTGFIAMPSDISEFKNINKHVVSLMHAKPGVAISYYTGAAWDEFGSINSMKEWEVFIENKSAGISNPCTVQLK